MKLLTNAWWSVRPAYHHVSRLADKRLTVQILRIMKLLNVFLFAFFLSASAGLNGQQVTISAKNAKLVTVLKEIRKQTNFTYVAKQELLLLSKPVTVDLKNASVEEALEACFKDQPFSYNIEGKIITIEPDGKKVAAEVSRLVSPSVSIPPITVRGRIVNENGEPVIASILVKGTKRGTTSDQYGDFELSNIQDNAILLISATNIETREINVNGQSSVAISVKTKIGEEEAVTVSTGYWTTEKTKNLGSISKVNAKEIENQPVTSPLLALQARVPGLEIAPTSGVPGSSVALKIRGLNSLRMGGGTDVNGNIPLYVIDGVQIDPNPVGTASVSIVKQGFDPLSTINPANIESIQVLKDADATAIYGSRGANGVILIKTKNRITQGRVNVDLNIYKGIGEMVNRVDMLTREEYLQMRREAIYNDGGDAVMYYENPDFGPLAFPDLLFWDTTRYTDWQKELLGGTSDITDVQVNLGAGNATTSIGIGLGYHKETLIYPGDFGYRRYNGNINLSHHSEDNRFTANLTATFGANNHKIFDSNIMLWNTLTLSPVGPPLYTDDQSLNWALNKFNLSTWNNPASWTRSTHDSRALNLVTNMNLSYRILRGLYAKTNLGYSVFDQNEVIKYPISSLQPGPFGPLLGRATHYNAGRTSWIIEPQLAYHYEAGKHDLDLLVGSTFQEATSREESYRGTGYTSDALLGSLQGAADITSRQNSSEYHYVGIYARAMYNYNDQYLISLTGRRDGSSRFGPGRRFGNFGSIAAGWIFSNTALLKNSALLSFGKIRASYGATGNDQINDGNYIPRYSSVSGNYHGIVTLNSVSLFNPDYAWEETKKLEVALETGFFDNRITVEAAWYRNRSSNQLVDYGLPGIAGFSSVKLNFPATIQNTGFELSAGFKIVNSRNFQWLTSANLSIPKNKLVVFDNIEQSPYATVYKVGEPLLIQRGYRWKGVDPTTGIHDFVDLDKDGAVTSSDMEFSRSIDAEYYAGLSNTFSYKRFELSFLFQFSKRLEKVPAFGLPGIAMNQPKSVLGRWQKGGDITNIQKFTSGFSQAASDAYTRWQESDAALQNISFIRLKTFSISYSLTASALQKIKIKGLRIFIQGQNLFTFTEFEGLDPETLNGVPPLKSLSGGVQIKL